MEAARDDHRNRPVGGRRLQRGEPALRLSGQEPSRWPGHRHLSMSAWRRECWRFCSNARTSLSVGCCYRVDL